MSAITDIFSSERGLFAVLLVVGATVLTAMGKMTVDSWQSFAQIVFGTYVAGKTVTSAVGLMAARKQPPAPIAAPAAAPIVAVTSITTPATPPTAA